MSRLLRDRYFVDPSGLACDLATGETGPPRPEHEQACHGLGVAALHDVLDHGRDGAPRSIVLDLPSRVGTTAATERAAHDARVRGYVPLRADIYLELRQWLGDELRDRALLLVVPPSVARRRWRELLLDAAARSARPHVLLAFRDRRQGELAREARAAYGVPSAVGRRSEPVPRDLLPHLQRERRAAEFIASGQHAAAERLLRDVAAALGRRGARGYESRTLTRLGTLLMERGRARDADGAFDDAAAAAAVAADEDALIEARIGQALARTDLLQLTGAESLCRAALAIPGITPRRAVAIHAVLARVLVWQQRIDDAVDVELPCAPDDDDLDAFTAASIDAMAVRLHLIAGRVFEAGVRAQALADRARESAPLIRAIAATARLRVTAASGDLGGASAHLDEVVTAARAAHAPLRAARARLLFALALQRAGRGREASVEIGRLRRVQLVAPPLLRRAIQHCANGTATGSPTSAVSVPRSAARLVTMLRVAHESEDDRAAVHAVMERVAQEVGAGRIELWTADAGPATAVMAVGTGAVTILGARVLETGISIGPEPGRSGIEVGTPVRLGSRLLAALTVRWAIDQQPPAYAIEVTELAAAVMAPRIEAMLASARTVAAAASAVPELIGMSAAMAEVRRAIMRAAQAPFAALIEGESGVGKELVARAIHQLGPRRDRRFCDVNCAALPDDLFESELFGHAKGAFTGAVAERAGLFEDADGGTLFLDEVADLSQRAQAKLLRALQQQEIRRVGESFSRKVDVRIVAAANRDMRAEVDASRFRMDLLYRLDVVRIRIPPLRERPEDIALLVQHFWRAAAARVGTRAVLTHAVVTALGRYHWPGNVRELQNVVAALAVAAPAAGRVRPSLLPAAIAGAAAITSPRLDAAREQFERRFVEAALARAGGSRSRAAREMGISRQGLLKMMARLGLVNGSAQERVS